MLSAFHSQQHCHLELKKEESAATKKKVLTKWRFVAAYRTQIASIATRGRGELGTRGQLGGQFSTFIIIF